MTTLNSEIAQRFKAGDLDALRQIVELFQRRLFGLGVRLLGEPDEAADLCQDVFLRVFEKRHTYDSSRPFDPWLFRVAVNLGREKLRHRREIPAGDELPEQKVEAEGEEKMLTEERQTKVRAALARLKPKYRESLALRFESELSLQEIARTLGVPQGTVKSRLSRGLEMFAKVYASAGGERQ